MISEEDLIGKTEKEAVELLSELTGRRRYRITRRDTEHYIITMDFCMDRFNLELDDGIVTEVEMG